MNKAIGVAGAALAAAFALSGVAASTATARCAMSTQSVGNFEDISADGDCINESIIRTKLYIIVDAFESSLGNYVYCAEASGTAKGYSSDACTGEEHEGSGEWVKIDGPEPSVVFLSGEGPTVLLANKAKETVPTELQSELAKVTGKQLTLDVTLLGERGGASGIYLAKFFEAKNASSGEPCETAGAAEKGEIEVGPEGKSDPTELVWADQLAVGEIFTVNEFSFTCNAGTLKVKVKGNALGSIEPGYKEVEKGSNEIKVGLTCSSTTGVPSKTKYTNFKGEAKVTALTVTVAGKSAGGCELVGSSTTSTISLLPNKMVEVLG